MYVSYGRPRVEVDLAEVSQLTAMGFSKPSCLDSGYQLKNIVLQHQSTQTLMTYNLILQFELLKRVIRMMEKS